MEVRNVITEAPSISVNLVLAGQRLSALVGSSRDPKISLGAFRHGYEMIAPRDSNRYIDLWQWKKLRAHGCVRRFWADEPDQIGRLVHMPADEAPVFWAFDYACASFGTNEPDYRFGAHAFAPGEQIGIQCRGGEDHSLRIVAVQDLCPPALK